MSFNPRTFRLGSIATRKWMTNYPVVRHQQRDEIRDAFEADPIFSKQIDFVRRGFLGALGRARFWSRHGLRLPKDVKLPDPWHKKVSTTG